MGASQNIEKARRSLKVAEAMLSKAYPVAKDPKLFLAVSEDIFFALMECVEAVLSVDGKSSSDAQSDVHDDPAKDVLSAFRESAPKYHFGSEDFKLLSNLSRIVSAHRESPVEFVRQESFVICDGAYCFERLSFEEMQNFLFAARQFLERAASAVDNVYDIDVDIRQ